MADEGVTYLMVARLDRHGVDQFAEYERLVLPLVGHHGGRLERRLATADRLIEVPDDPFGVEPFRERTEVTLTRRLERRQARRLGLGREVGDEGEVGGEAV